MKAELIKRLQAVLPTQGRHIIENAANTDVITVDLVNNENDAALVHEQNNKVVAGGFEGPDQQKVLMHADHTSSSETAMVIDLVEI